MAEEVTRLRIFVAVPSDSQDEGDTTRAVIDEIRKGLADSKKLDLFYVDWDELFGGIADTNLDDFVDRQIGSYDVFIGLVWRDLGCEWQNIRRVLEKALEKHQTGEVTNILLYFSDKPIKPSELSDDILEDLKTVNSFKEEVMAKGLSEYYVNSIDLEHKLRRALTKIVTDWKPSSLFDAIRSEIQNTIDFSNDDSFVRVAQFIEKRLGSVVSLYLVDHDSLPQVHLKHAPEAFTQQIKSTWNISETPFSPSRTMVAGRCFVMEVRSPDGQLEGYLVCEKSEYSSVEQNRFSKDDYLYFVVLSAELSGRYHM